MKGNKSRTRLRRLARVAGVCAALLLALAVAGKYWVLPAVVRRHVADRLARYVDGDVRIDAVTFNYFGPVVLRGVTVTGTQGSREGGAARIRVEEASASLEGLAALRPKLTAVAIDGLAVRLARQDGEWVVPLKKLPEWTESLGDLRELDVRNARLTLSAERAGRADSTVCAGADLSLRAEGDDYRLRVTLSPAEGAGRLAAVGRIDRRTGRARLTVEVEHTIAPAVSRALLDLAGSAAIRRIGGDLRGEIAVDGPLGDWARLGLRGRVRLSGGTIETPHGLLARDLSALVDISGSAVKQFRVTQFAAACCGGRIDGDGTLDVPAAAPLRYEGRLEAGAVDLARLLPALGKDPKTSSGQMEGVLTVRGTGGDLRHLTGRCKLLLTEANMWQVPVICDIFRHLGMERLDPLSRSDLAVVADLEGPVAVIDAAHLANPLYAIEAEKGGTVHLHAGDLDLHVVAVPAKGFAGFLAELPVVSMVTNFGLVRLPAKLLTSLTRLHVTGRWDEPASVRIAAKPVEGIGKATFDFFREASEAGGQLGEGLLKSLAGLADAGENAHGEKE
jgi:hypothetical protein